MDTIQQQKNFKIHVYAKVSGLKCENYANRKRIHAKTAHNT